MSELLRQRESRLCVRIVAALAVLLILGLLSGSALGAPVSTVVVWKYAGPTPSLETVATFTYEDSASSLQDFALQVSGSSPSTYQWTGLAVTVNGVAIPNACSALTGPVGGIGCKFASGAVNDGAVITLSSDAAPGIPPTTGGTLFVEDWLNEGTSIPVGGLASSPRDARAAREAVIRAQLATRSVHYVLTLPEGRIVSDVAGHTGVQRLTERGKAGQLTKIFVHSTIYLRGNARGLHDVGFPPSFTSRYAGKWISIRPGSALYKAFLVNATLASWVAHDLPTGGLSLVGGTLGGRAVWGVRATVGGLTTYVPYNTQQPLPVAGEAVGRGAGQPVRERFTLSRWNEAVNVKAPAHAVRIH